MTVALAILSRQQLRRWFAQNPLALSEAAGDNPFITPEWLALHLDHVIPESFCLGVLNGPVGQALLMRAPDQPGRWTSLGSYYASLYAEVSAPGLWCDAEVATPAGISRQAPATICLQPIAETSAKAWCEHFRSMGWWAKTFDAFANWTLPSRDLSYQNYLQQRPSRLQHTLRRKAKLFHQNGHGNRLQIITDAANFVVGMAAFEAVYARSWKPKETHPVFIRAWAELCASKGWLRLGIAWHGDTPVAAQLWFVYQGRANIFKLAHDEHYQNLSAGTVLSAALFEHALDVDKVVEIDFLSGDDRYKADWVNHRQQRYGVIATNPRTLTGLWVGSREQVSAISRGWRQALTQRFAVPPDRGFAESAPQSATSCRAK